MNHYHSTDYIESVFSPSPTWDYKLLQLDPGLLGYQSYVVQLTEAEFRIEMLRRTVRSIQLKRSRVFFVGLLVQSPRPALWKGHEAGNDIALIFGPSKQDIIIPKDSIVVGLEVSIELASKLNLMSIEPGLWKCHRSALDVFKKNCLSVKCKNRSSQLCHVLDEATQKMALQEMISEFLSTLVYPLRLSTSRQYEIAGQVEELASFQGWDEGISMDQTSDVLGIPLRTIHRSFKELYDMGPQSYLRLVRLHHFRQSLLKGGVDRIADVATSVGFHHVGRAAKHYHTLFGELPRQTLKRTFSAQSARS